MAQVPLTDANSVTLLDGSVLFFTPNTAIASGKLRVARQDGTGTALLSAQALTVKGRKKKCLFMGTSHTFGVVDITPQQSMMALLESAGTVMEPYNAATDVFAANGAKLGDILAGQGGLLSGMMAAIATWKATHDVYVGLEGLTNDNTYSNMNYVNTLIGYKRTLSQMFALAGARVILIAQPPNSYWLKQDSYNPAQHALVEALRQAEDDDMAANFRTEYGAVAYTASYRQDTIMYADGANGTNSPYSSGDYTHNSAAGNEREGRMHHTLAFVNGSSYQIPARLAPTAMVVDTAAKTLTFTKTNADALVFHELSVNGGATYTPITQLPVSLPDGTYTPQVRVAAYGGGVAGPALVYNAPVTIGAAAGTPGALSPRLDLATEMANMQVMAPYKVKNVQTAGPSYEAIIYAPFKLPADERVGFGVTLISGFTGQIFVGISAINRTIKLTPQVPFPDYGIRIEASSVSPTNGGGPAGDFSYAADSKLFVFREASALPGQWDLVYYFGTTEFARIVNIPLVGECLVSIMGGFTGSIMDGLELFAESGLLPR